MDSSTRIGIAVTTLSVVFLFYCAYLERRNSNLRKRLRHRKEKKILENISLREILPEIRDPKAQQAFILNQIQRAEELMTQGRYEKAILHFANAIAVCADPHRLVLALKETLPPQAFDLLLKVLADSYGKRFLRYCDSQAVEVSSNKTSGFLKNRAV